MVYTNRRKVVSSLLIPYDFSEDFNNTLTIQENVGFGARVTVNDGFVKFCSPHAGECDTVMPAVGGMLSIEVGDETPGFMHICHDGACVEKMVGVN
jgi:hypothetical protein